VEKDFTHFRHGATGKRKKYFFKSILLIERKKATATFVDEGTRRVEWSLFLWHILHNAHLMNTL
jgi:hypothetical protein